MDHTIQSCERRLPWHQAAAGDLVLFSGKTLIHQRIQEWAGNRWGQVAIVIYLPQVAEPCVLSATSFPLCPDIETGVLRAGVSTTLLYATWQAFYGELLLARLKPSLTPDLIERLISFRSLVNGCPFDFSKLSFRRTVQRSHTSFSPDAFMCASLVAFAYQSIGILPLPPQGPLPNNTWPSDFSADGKIRLTHGYSLHSLPLS